MVGEVEEVRGAAMKIARTFPVEVVVVPELVAGVVPELVAAVVPELVEVLVEWQWLRRAPTILTRSPAAGGFAPLPKNTLALVNV